MKLKFPKKIMIGSAEFLIEKNPEIAGGDFTYCNKGKKGKITIGTKHLKSSPTRVLETIIHELKEVIQVEQSVRYQRLDLEEGEYLFSYGHKEHTDLCSRLAGLLNYFID